MTPDLVLLTRQGIKGTKVQSDFVLDVFSSLNSGWSSSGSVIVLSCSTRSRYVHSTQTRRPLAKCWTLEPNHRKRGNEGTTSVTWTSSPSRVILLSLSTSDMSSCSLFTFSFWTPWQLPRPARARFCVALLSVSLCMSLLTRHSYWYRREVATKTDTLYLTIDN